MDAIFSSLSLILCIPDFSIKYIFLKKKVKARNHSSQQGGGKKQNNFQHEVKQHATELPVRC